MKKVLVIFLVFLAIIGLGALYVSTYTLKEIETEGCVYSSESQIKDEVKKYAYMNNTILLYWRHKFKPIKKIPFVAKLDITFVNKNKIKVKVYEKKIAGCIEYMEKFIYFDKDGIVLEASSEKKKDVPYIEGLTFESWEMGKKLPVDDKDKFNNILTVTQLKEKFGLTIDGVTFTPENEIILHSNGIDIEVGDGSYLAVQMMNLGNILKQFEGQSGVLYMKDFKTPDGVASFKTKQMLENEAKKASEKKQSKDKKEEETTEDEDSDDEDSDDEDADDESDYDESSDYDEDSGDDWEDASNTDAYSEE